MTKTDDDLVVNAGDTFVASFDIEILKAEESLDGKRGRVVALVSAYNVEYRMGGFFRPVMHVIEPGAFADSINAQDAIPVFWQHNWNWSEQPPIGTGVPEEAGRGLQVTGDFFLDVEAGRSVFNAIKAKALKQWSIGYSIGRHEIEDRDDGARVIHVKTAELLEASSVLRGANPETDTLMVAKHQVPKEINEALDAVRVFMKEQIEVNQAMATLVDEVAGLKTDLESLQVSHEILVGSFDDGNESSDEEPESGEVKVEPASVVGDGSEAPEIAAAQDASAPEEQQEDNPAAPSPGSETTDLDELFDRARNRVIARCEAEVNERKQEIVDRAGRLLPGDDDTVRDIESLTRVMRAENKVKHLWDSTERRTEVEALAAEQ